MNPTYPAHEGYHGLTGIHKGPFINYDLGGGGLASSRGGGHNFFLGYSYRGVTFLGIPVGGGHFLGYLFCK